MNAQNRQQLEPLEFGRLSVWRDSATHDEKQARNTLRGLNCAPALIVRSLRVTSM